MKHSSFTDLEQELKGKYIEFSKINKKVRLSMDDSDIGFMNGWNDCLSDVLTIIKKIKNNHKKQ